MVIVNTFADADGAEGFMADPVLSEAMARAGVDSEPQIWLCDHVEWKDYR